MRVNLFDDSYSKWLILYVCLQWFHINFRWDVIPSNSLTGAGPNPNTVREPAAICVLPASSTKYRGKPLLKAFAYIISISSSVGHLTAIFAQPVLSHAERAEGHCLFERL